MKPTILEGDVVFVNRLAYDLKVPFTTWHLAKWADPARGDIVVCFAPDDGMRLVKRVVGLPGDVLQLRHDCLFINGVAVAYAPLVGPAAGVRDLAPAERGSALFAREQIGARSHAVMALPQIPAPRDFGPVRVPAGHYFMMGDNRDVSRDSRYFGFMPQCGKLSARPRESLSLATSTTGCDRASTGSSLAWVKRSRLAPVPGSRFATANPTPR